MCNRLGDPGIHHLNLEPNATLTQKINSLGISVLNCSNALYVGLILKHLSEI